MNDAEFAERLWLSSVPLVRLDSQHLPSAYASGCLINYFGKRILLTVSHATGNQGNWGIQCRYVPGKGTEIYQLGAMHFLARGSQDQSGLEAVDFSYVEVPTSVVTYRQGIEARTNMIDSETPVTVHAPSLEETPHADARFGFCGVVMPELEKHPVQTHFAGEPRIYLGLSFLRSEDDYHVFSLPFPHPGDEHFKGCSGAAILSNAGSLVALVCSGCVQRNEIWGISLSAYKTAIDILVGNIEQRGP